MDRQSMPSLQGSIHGVPTRASFGFVAIIQLKCVLNNYTVHFEIQHHSLARFCCRGNCVFLGCQRIHPPKPRLASGVNPTEILCVIELRQSSVCPAADAPEHDA